MLDGLDSASIEMEEAKVSLSLLLLYVAKYQTAFSLSHHSIG